MKQRAVFVLVCLCAVLFLGLCACNPKDAALSLLMGQKVNTEDDWSFEAPTEVTANASHEIVVDQPKEFERASFRYTVHSAYYTDNYQTAGFTLEDFPPFAAKTSYLTKDGSNTLENMCFLVFEMTMTQLTDKTDYTGAVVGIHLLNDLHLVETANYSEQRQPVYLGFLIEETEEITLAREEALQGKDYNYFSMQKGQSSPLTVIFLVPEEIRNEPVLSLDVGTSTRLTQEDGEWTVTRQQCVIPIAQEEIGERK